MPSEHIHSLDSVRGLAALSVLFQHSLIVFPVFLAALFLHPTHSWAMWILTHTPLHLVWDGHEAVIVFFVLSGFVLSLPYYDESANGYGAFLVRRICRIYLPYLVAVACSMTILAFHPHLDANTTVHVSSWFRSMWNATVNGTMITNLVGMSGKFTQIVDTSTWTLVYEMRISLFFPVIPLMLRRRVAWYLPVLFGIELLAIGVVLMPKLPFDLGGTIYYTGFFVGGATLARYRHAILGRLAALSRRGKVILLAGTLGLYNWTWLVPDFGHVPILRGLDSIAPTADVCIAVAAMIGISFAVIPGRIQRTLEHPTLRWLGKISYSLYLIHPVVLLAVVYGLSPFLPLPVCVALVSPFAVGFASLFHRGVEQPSIWLGRKGASWMGRATERQAASPDQATT